MTAPLVVVVEPLYVSASPSGSAPMMLPSTTPVMGSGTPTTALPVGAELVATNGLTVTATVRDRVWPLLPNKPKVNRLISPENPWM